MAPSSIRKAIGAVKDQTSIGIAKVASSLAPELEVAIVKATSHDDDPADEKYIREVLNLMSYSRGYVSACVVAVSKRLSKTRDWIVALKALMLVQRLLTEGNLDFKHEIVYATRGGTRLLNMADFRDEAHSNSWDHSAFVRAYSLYLDQKLEAIVHEWKYAEGEERGSGSAKPYDHEYSHGFRDEFSGHGSGGSRRSKSFGEFKAVVPLREMPAERLFNKISVLQTLLGRFLSCRPTGMTKNSRMVLIALYPIVKESFQLYAELCEILAVLLDRFFDMEYRDCLKAFDAYASAAKQIDELAGFYNWGRDSGIARPSEYPEVQRITGKVLETLEEFVRDRGIRSKSPEGTASAPAGTGTAEPDINEIKALPAPEARPPPPPVVQQASEGDLVNLGGSTVDGENRLALSLFAETKTDGAWEAFPSTEVSSAWENPAAETGKADWELALVETTSNLARQKASLGGGFDPLLLNGIYDQGIVRQHTSMEAMSGGSASSVALPGKREATVLALPAPDGTVHSLGQDPFSASGNFPPPSYVQMADMEKKQALMTQEQLVWQQYATNGMQGHSGLSSMTAVPVSRVGPPAVYYYPPY